MILEAYKKAWDVIRKKPMMLWGLSLLSGLLAAIAGILTSPILGASLAIGFVLEAGMAKIYLDGLDGKKVNSDQLFAGFHRFARVAGGMGWKALWIFIWCLIPFVGPIIAVYKAYQYAFVPYILMEQPDVTATEALRLSMKMTDGKKGTMFGADVLLWFIIGAAVIVLGLFSRIPYIGILFLLALVLFFIIVLAFSGLFVGLYRAYIYRSAVSGEPAALEE